MWLPKKKLLLVTFEERWNYFFVARVIMLGSLIRELFVKKLSLFVKLSDGGLHS